MKKYFKIIGILELICVVIAGIVDIIYIFKSIPLISSNSLYFIQLLIILVVLIFLGPAIGLLFISHANLLPEQEWEVNRKTMKMDKIYNDESLRSIKVESKYKIGDMVDCIDEGIKKTYYITEPGEIVIINNDDIYVKFATEKGHFTLHLDINQIRKSR